MHDIILTFFEKDQVLMVEKYFFLLKILVAISIKFQMLKPKY